MNPELIKRGAIILGVGGALVIVTVFLTAKAKDRAYKEFVKKHDEEMAKELSVSFNRRIDGFDMDIKKSIGKFKAAVNELCGQDPYNIDPVFA